MTPKHEHPLANHLRNEARKLRKCDATLSQTAALDQAAKQNGYENWRHFTNSLPQIPTQRFFVTLTSSWRDPATKNYFSESIDVPLSKPLQELFPKPVDIRSLIGDCTIDYEENTIRKPTYFAHSNEVPQSYVRASLNKSARFISFVSATGLLLSNAWSKPMHGFSKILGERDPSGFDHTKIWRSRDGKYVITTEPYLPRLEQEQEKLLEQSERAGYQVETANWLGIHNPNLNLPSAGTRLVLLSHKEKGLPLTDLVSRLNKLPNDFLPGAWSGKTTQL